MWLAQKKPRLTQLRRAWWSRRRRKPKWSLLKMPILSGLMRLPMWNSCRSTRPIYRAAQGVLCPGEQIPYCDNTAVSRLRYDAGRFTVDFLNDSTHLPEEISTFARQRWWRTTETRKDHNLWFTGPDSSGTYHALLGRNPAGFVRVSGGEDGGAGILEAMELLQEHRGQDLGQQLLGMAVSHFRARGVQELTAPKPLVQAAEGFLLRCGFCRDEAGGLTRRIAVPGL